MVEGSEKCQHALTCKHSQKAEEFSSDNNSNNANGNNGNSHINSSNDIF